MRIFLIANISIKIVFKIFLITFNNINIKFAKKKTYLEILYH